MASNGNFIGKLSISFLLKKYFILNIQLIIYKKDSGSNDHPNISKIFAVDINNMNVTLFHEYFHTNLRN